jgi:predicted phosphoribosyltransferase
MFKSREEAGKKLAKELASYKKDPETIVIGLARGGVVVAAEVAHALKLPLDLILVRKIGAPGNEELALGAVAGVGNPVYNDEIISLLGATQDYLTRETEKQRVLIEERMRHYHTGHTPQKLKGKKILLIDDGIATGASMKVALKAIRSEKPALIHLAVPVAAPQALEELSPLADQTLCLLAPPHFQAVGAFYEEFEQVTDEEITELLKLHG